MCSQKKLSSIPPVILNGRQFDAMIFYEDLEQYLSAKKALMSSPEYKHCFQRKKEALRKLTSLKQEYMRISKEKEPVELQGLARAKRDLVVADASIQEVKKRLILENDAMAQELRMIMETLPTLELSDPAYIEQEARQIDIQHKLAALNKSSKSRISRACEKRRNALIEVDELEQLKADLLQQKSNEILSVNDEITEIDIVLDTLIQNSLGQFNKSRQKVVSLLQRDPNVSPSTVQAILQEQPDYIKGYWSLETISGASFSMISMEIKRNPKQSMAELIASVAETKGTCFTDAMVILTGLRDKDKLFYFSNAYEDLSRRIIRWHPQKY